MSRPPCVLHEDDDLLVVNKPAGLNTHSPSPYAGEGIYDWLRHREARWASLAIIHRLDKETSGVILFGKTASANRSLTEQFTQRSAGKKYLLVTDRPIKQPELIVKSKIARIGERYFSNPRGETAETHFRLLNSKFKNPNLKLLEAAPLTGRTHQIRVHAAENGFPILGDALYGGTEFTRVCLHATELSLRHPVTGKPVTFSAPADFQADARLALRAALIDPEQTDAFRLIHGASDGWPGWYVERLGDFLLSQSEAPLSAIQRAELERLTSRFSSTGAYHKVLSKNAGRRTPAESSPQLTVGKPAPDRFTVRENGLSYELSFAEGYSVGLFLDQRDNRRRLLTRHIARDFAFETRNSKFEILNLFAYTCGFSVAAAKAGAHTTNVDLSKKYLEWGKRNFALNGLDPSVHDFIYGDAFDWVRRLGKKGRSFDAIVVDPPTFSQSKEHGAFRAEADYGTLASATLPLLASGGALFASTNAAAWEPEDFVRTINKAAIDVGRRIVRQCYVPQPPDFPISRAEPAYLKTLWLQID